MLERLDGRLGGLIRLRRVLHAVQARSQLHRQHAHVRLIEHLEVPPGYILHFDASRNQPAPAQEFVASEGGITGHGTKDGEPPRIN